MNSQMNLSSRPLWFYAHCTAHYQHSQRLAGVEPLRGTAPRLYETIKP